MKVSNKIFGIIWEELRVLCVSYYTNDLAAVKNSVIRITNNLKVMVEFMERGE